MCVGRRTAAGCPQSAVPTPAPRRRVSGVLMAWRKAAARDRGAPLAVTARTALDMKISGRPPVGVWHDSVARSGHPRGSTKSVTSSGAAWLFTCSGCVARWTIDIYSLSPPNVHVEQQWAQNPGGPAAFHSHLPNVCSNRRWTPGRRTQGHQPPWPRCPSSECIDLHDFRVPSTCRRTSAATSAGWVVGRK